MKPYINLSGQVFGDWTVVEYVPGGRWLRRCACGTEKPVLSAYLRKGLSGGCGCKRGAKISAGKVVHGHALSSARTPEYQAWAAMRGRCKYPSCDRYPHYGGRGIKVCDRWEDSFQAFLDDVGPKPSPSHSLDRIDVNGNYEPGNVRWATPKQQMLNKRTTVRVTIDGETKTLVEWLSIYGLTRVQYQDRIRCGWSPEKAITTPMRHYKKAQ
jgi:hypothetical protein